jgi:hypothetical protein
MLLSVIVIRYNRVLLILMISNAWLCSVLNSLLLSVPSFDMLNDSKFLALNSLVYLVFFLLAQSMYPTVLYGSDV